MLPLNFLIIGVKEARNQKRVTQVGSAKKKKLLKVDLMNFRFVANFGIFRI